MTTSDFLLERLLEWGFYRIYGYPGDGINGIMGAFDRIGDKLQFIQVRHEEMAAFMACAHAKFTGETGICLATSGPGAIHLLNGLYDAKMDHAPVVAIVGQAATSALGGSYQQEVDLQVLLQDVVEYVYTVSSPAAMRHVVDRAVRTAKGMRAVTCVIAPKDVQEMLAVPEPPHALEDVVKPECLLAYEMNDAALPTIHGARLRLRVENQLGFKMVKWIREIRFVETAITVGKGYGGKNEDDEYFDLLPYI